MKPWFALPLLLALGACAQAPASPPHVRDQSAAQYLAQHGARLEVTLPAGPWVDAAAYVDPKQARAAQLSTEQTANNLRGNGLLGAVITRAVDAQSGLGGLQRRAGAAALADARPLAALLDSQPADTRFTALYNQAARLAGLPAGSGQVTARLLITPHVTLSADRGHLTLRTDLRLEDIAGGVLYAARIEATSASLRGCGNDCVDAGGLEPARVDQALQACAEQALALAMVDLQGGPASPERTLRYSLDGWREVERGRLLPTAPGYLRYQALDGTLKVSPAVLEAGL
ncbi:hypothetical protein [Pseudomonas sp. NPDC007930]|uniref:hypothetical protein n=1 Tax=Pseudomonas sp. NPDC007930 TaxID=3364417 RepID=UPI0036EF4757